MQPSLGCPCWELFPQRVRDLSKPPFQSLNPAPRVTCLESLQTWQAGPRAWFHLTARRPDPRGHCWTATREDGAQDSWVLRPPRDTRMNLLLGPTADSHLACELGQDTGASVAATGLHCFLCLFWVPRHPCLPQGPRPGAGCVLGPSCGLLAPGQAGVGHVSSPGQASRLAGHHRWGNSHCLLLAQSPQPSQSPSHTGCCLCDAVLTFQGSCPLRQTSG